MARRSWALLLVLSWIILSGFDVVEDLDLPDEVELCKARSVTPLGTPWSCRLVNNIVESADSSLARDPVLPVQRVEQHASSTALNIAHAKLKLHKLHAIFLI
jgi:hypothetical protein